MKNWIEIGFAILKFSITQDLNKTEKDNIWFFFFFFKYLVCLYVCVSFYVSILVSDSLFCQIPTFSGFPVSPNGNMQMLPIMYPAFVPGLIPMQNQEQMNRGAGIYAVPVPPSLGPISGLPPNALIPLTYNLPT